MKNPAIVLGGGINGLSVSRSLGRAAVPVHLLGTDEGDTANYSRFSTAQTLPSDADPQHVVEQILTVCDDSTEKPALIFTSDEYLEVVSCHREVLQDRCLFNIPSRRTVETVLDKGLFNEFTEAADLPAPRAWSPGTNSELIDCADQATFPVVMKPVFAHNAEEDKFNQDGRFAKMILIHDQDALSRYFSELTSCGARLLIQEYIEGPDNEHYSYCSYRDGKNNELAGIGIRKHRLFPVHAGAGTFVELVVDNELEHKGREVVEKLKFTGISSVCFKRDLRSSRLIIHEMNGRLPMVHSASNLCGIEFPLIVYRDAVGQTQKIAPRPAKGKWIALNTDLRALRGYREEGELSLLQWLRSLIDVRHCVEFAIDDIRPFLKVVQQRLVRFLHSTFGLSVGETRAHDGPIKYRTRKRP